MGTRKNRHPLRPWRELLLLCSAVVLAVVSPACTSDFVGGGPTGGGNKDGVTCEIGATRCESNVVLKCNKDSTGEANWLQDTFCTSHQRCEQQAGAAVCVDLANCTDGKKNQDETDVDCGGTKCGVCAEGKKCGKDDDCLSKACINGKCAPCKVGQNSCLGNMLRACKSDNSGWDTVSNCNPKSYERCDPTAKACVKLTAQGSTTPTGKYFLFGFFEKGKTEFKGGYDVDGYGEYLYVNNNKALDVYKVTLMDSDGDEKLEPNQHPDNKDKPGPIEQRTLKFIKTYTNVTLGQPSVAEIFAAKDKVYFLRKEGSNDNIYEFIFATGQTNLVIKGNAPISCIGYDEIKNQWYGAYNSATRVVYNFWPNGGGWAAQFWYPNLAGSHLDGIEVVQDPKTKTPYIYVSDMTSDFLAQYYLDKTTGQWVQKNIFEYKETKNQYVEGMGFGAFQHFWATSGSALYEVGGGDLQKYVGVIK